MSSAQGNEQVVVMAQGSGGERRGECRAALPPVWLMRVRECGAGVALRGRVDPAIRIIHTHRWSRPFTATMLASPGLMAPFGRHTAPSPTPNPRPPLHNIGKVCVGMSMRCALMPHRWIRVRGG